jgi:drug/metabolite transporter (DMT)-like permease
VAIATASTAVTALIVGLVVGDLDLTPAGRSLAWLAILGLSSQSAGYLLISLSLPRLPAVVTSIILLAQPVATVALAMVLLGEAPSPVQLAGVALVVGGIAFATMPGRGRPVYRSPRSSAAGS